MGPGCENLGRDRFGNEAARSTLAGRALSEAAPGRRGHPKVGDVPEKGGPHAGEPGNIVADNIFGRMAPCCQLTTVSGGRAGRRGQGCENLNLTAVRESSRRASLAGRVFALGALRSCSRRPGSPEGWRPVRKEGSRG